MKSLKSPNEKPSASEFGALIAYLARLGIASQIAHQVLGNNPNGRTRKEIVQNLIEWIRVR